MTEADQLSQDVHRLITPQFTAAEVICVLMCVLNVFSNAFRHTHDDAHGLITPQFAAAEIMCVLICVPICVLLCVLVRVLVCVLVCVLICVLYVSRHIQL